ncbi:MAG: hypothetical protein ACOZB3_10520 [Calditrichota bacterium]
MYRVFLILATLVVVSTSSMAQDQATTPAMTQEQMDEAKLAEFDERGDGLDTTADSLKQALRDHNQKIDELQRQIKEHQLDISRIKTEQKNVTLKVKALKAEEKAYKAEMKARKKAAKGK